MYKHKNGFTLLEILITTAILAIISSMIIVNLVPIRNKLFFDTDANLIKYIMQNAQNRAILGDNGTSWGVKFTNSISTGNTIEIFSGNGYSTSTVVLKESLSQASKFSDPAIGFSNTIVFNQLTGKPVYPIKIVIKRVRHNEEYVLSVSSIGKISKRLEKGMIGFWPLDEGSGTVAYDASYESNNGTLNGPIYTNGKSGKALSFNGTSDYVSGPTTDFPTGSSPVSMFAWVKTSATSRETMVSYGSSATGQAVSINVNQLGSNGHFVVDFYNDYVDSGIKINDGNWHFVGFSLSASSTSITLDVDGIPVSATLPSVPNILNGTNYQIGRWVTAGTGDIAPYYFSGLIDDVRVYNRALTSSEINEIYENY